MIAAAVENRTLPMLVRLPRSAAPVAALYSARDFRPAWLGHPGRLATLRAALDDADRHGIEDDVIRAALREADAPSGADARPPLGS